MVAILNIILLIVGFVLLVKGADFFVDGAAGIAEKLKVSTFVIGLTVVALGTSAPEAAVSVVGSISGSGDVIIGNVIGSNILNVLLILGIAALITDIPVERSSRVVEIPFLILVSGVFVALALVGNDFTWWEGLILLTLYGAFMAYTIFMAVRSKATLLEEASPSSVAVSSPDSAEGLLAKLSAWYEGLKDKTWFLIVITIVGLAMVVGGAELVVNSAKYIAQELLGIPEMVVGLTVVAFGTSLPELVTSISAAKKGDMGIATGNIIGSNLANILFVAGLGFLSSGSSVPVINPAAFTIDAIVSVLAIVVLWLFAVGKKHTLGKVAGTTFIIMLVAYYAYLFLSAFGYIII